jgi:hypothetical protein
VPYHVRVSTKSSPSFDEVRLDLSQEQLEKAFLRPYREGRPIVVSGRTIFLTDLVRLLITQTDETSSDLRPLVEAEERNSAVVAGLPIEWLIAEKGRDVTDEFITEPPGSAVDHQDRGLASSAGRHAPRVHSREKARKDIERAISDLDAVRSTFARGQEDLFRRQFAYRSWWDSTRSMLLQDFDDQSIADRVLPSAPAFAPPSAPLDFQYQDVYRYMDQSRDRLGALLNDLDRFGEVASLGTISDAADAYRGIKALGAVGEREHDVFICHAIEDKDAVVRPLANELRRLGLRVWYDEYELRIGDSLRRKIDQGLARSRFGIVVLSPAFFAKEWPQRELDGLVSRETAQGAQLILPVWHNVGRDDVLHHSPPLADKLARSTAQTSIADIAVEIANVVSR